MKPHRRGFLHLVAGSVALPAALRAVSAQDYPRRQVRIIVGFASGSAMDILARLIGQWLSERFGQPFVIEDRPGAGGTLAAEAVVRARPDGYTLLLAGSPDAINATLYNNLNFKFLRDIAPVAGISRAPNVMVGHPSFPVKTVPEFIRYAKANPKQSVSKDRCFSPALLSDRDRQVRDEGKYQRNITVLEAVCNQDNNPPP